MCPLLPILQVGIALTWAQNRLVLWSQLWRSQEVASLWINVPSQLRSERLWRTCWRSLEGAPDVQAAVLSYDQQGSLWKAYADPFWSECFKFWLITFYYELVIQLSNLKKSPQIDHYGDYKVSLPCTLTTLFWTRAAFEFCVPRVRVNHWLITK